MNDKPSFHLLHPDEITFDNICGRHFARIFTTGKSFGIFTTGKSFGYFGGIALETTNEPGYSRFPDKPIAGQDHGDIVLAAILQCLAHERLTGVVRGNRALQNGTDGPGIDHVGQPIGAKQQLILIGQRKAPGLRFDFPLSAECTGQHVAKQVRGRLFGMDDA